MEWEDTGETMSVDFDVDDPAEADFHSIAVLLKRFLEGRPFSAGELSQLIVTQTEYVGKVVRLAEFDAEDPTPPLVGVVSLVNLRRHAGLACVRQIVDYVRGRVASCGAEGASLCAQFDALLRDHTVGLVVNARIINIPFTIAPPLHAQFHEEVRWAEEFEADSPYACDVYLLLASYHRGASGHARPQQKRTRRGGAGDGRDEPVYDCPEDAVYARHAIFHADFARESATASSAMTGNVLFRRQVIAVRRSAVPQILAEMKRELST